MLLSGGTTEEEMMRADVIEGEVRIFSASLHLIVCLFGSTDQINRLLWVRKLEDCVIATVLAALS